MPIVAEKNGRIVYVGLDIVKAMKKLGLHPNKRVKTVLIGDKVTGRAKKAIELFKERLNSDRYTKAFGNEKRWAVEHFEREVLEEMEGTN